MSGKLVPKSMSTLELIVKELKTLPPAKLKQAAGYIQRLKNGNRKTLVAALKKTAGSLPSEDTPLGERVGRSKGKLSLGVPSRNWRKEIRKRNWRA